MATLDVTLDNDTY